MPDPISDLVICRLKAATRDLVKACGGLERAGEVCSLSTSQLSRCQKPGTGDVIGIPQALALEAECGLPLVTTVMAEVHGRRLTDPDGERIDAVHVFSRHADVCRAAADAIATGANAQADGELTPAEAELLDRAYGDIERAVGAARMAVAGVRAGKPRVVGGRG